MKHMQENGIKIKDLMYYKTHPYPISGEIVLNIIYKYRYNRKVKRHNFDRLKQYLEL